MTARAVKLTKVERWHLGYLARSSKLLWGGHLSRNEPISDPDMQRWLDLGLIESVHDRGYQITAAGRAALREGEG